MLAKKNSPGGPVNTSCAASAFILFIVDSFQTKTPQGALRCCYEPLCGYCCERNARLNGASNMLKNRHSLLTQPWNGVEIYDK